MAEPSPITRRAMFAGAVALPAVAALPSPAMSASVHAVTTAEARVLLLLEKYRAARREAHFAFSQKLPQDIPSPRGSGPTWDRYWQAARRAQDAFDDLVSEIAEGDDERA